MKFSEKISGFYKKFSEKISGFYKKYSKIFLLLLFIAAALYPVLVPSSYLRGIGSKILMYAIFASSLNVINGYSGQFTLGHAGFICVGAYTGALLMTKLHVNFWIALICAGLVAGVFGMAISLPTRKLSGMYLTIVTLGFSEIIRNVVLNWTSFTGGAKGINSIPTPKFFGLKSTYASFYVALILLVVMLFCTNRVLKSRVGRAWIAIRENPTAAASLGVRLTLYKGLNLMYGAFWAGMIGAFQACYMQFIDPTMYTTEETFNVLSMTIVGGMGTLGGPLVGALIITTITEAFRFAARYRMIIYALLLIIMMWLRPQGLAGASNSAMVASAHRRKKKVVASKKEVA